MISMFCHTFAALLLAASGPSNPLGYADARNSDWPQWQGPNRDSISRETGLLKEWPSNGPPLLWKASGLGQGFSSVSVSNGHIYTMGNVGSDERVLALDEKNSGKLIWSAIVGPVRSNGGNYRGPRCTPTVDGDRVYALGINGDLLCLDARTGHILWHKDMSRDFGGHMMSMWGYSESPLIDGEKLICTPGGTDATLVALDKKSGDVIWKSTVPNAGGAAYASPVVAEVDGCRQYVQFVGHALIGVEAQTGRLLWRYARVANTVANIPTPIVHGNYVFASTGYQAGSALLRLVRKGDNVDAEEVYFLPAKVLQNHHGGLVLVGDYIYGGHGHNAGAPTCIKVDTGKVVWRQARAPGDRSASVAYADGNLYFRYENGVVALIEATPEGYHLKGRFDLPTGNHEVSWPHPVIANGCLFLRDQDVLLCYDVRKH